MSEEHGLLKPQPICASDSLKGLPIDNLKNDVGYFVEAIASLVKVAGIHFENLFNRIHSDMMEQEETVADVWGVIDTAWKIYCVLRTCPGLKQNAAEVQILLRALEKAEPLRNFVAHYNREVNKLALTVKPPLGHLSYVQILDKTHFQVIAVVPGTIRRYKGLQAVNPLGKEMRYSLGLLTYYIGDLNLDLSYMFEKLEDFLPFFQKFVESQAVPSASDQQS